MHIAKISALLLELTLHKCLNFSCCRLRFEQDYAFVRQPLAKDTWTYRDLSNSFLASYFTLAFRKVGYFVRSAMLTLLG
jgi:hypothetical protein